MSSTRATSFPHDQEAERGTRLEAANTLAPWLLCWRAIFRASFYSNDVADAAAPQLGEVTLAAGKDVEIVVPLVPRK